jgi:hypothetical protein
MYEFPLLVKIPISPKILLCFYYERLKSMFTYLLTYLLTYSTTVPYLMFNLLFEINTVCLLAITVGVKCCL